MGFWLCGIFGIWRQTSLSNPELYQVSCCPFALTSFLNLIICAEMGNRFLDLSRLVVLPHRLVSTVSSPSVRRNVS